MNRRRLIGSILVGIASLPFNPISSSPDRVEDEIGEDIRELLREFFSAQIGEYCIYDPNATIRINEKSGATSSYLGAFIVVPMPKVSNG